MGPLGDGNGEIKAFQRDPNFGFAHNETQPFGSQSSPSSLSGEKFNGVDADKLTYLQNTVPFDDDFQVEDAIETQVMDLGGETQVLNLAGEKQVMDDPDCFETQLLDDFDVEIAADSDDGGTDRTEVLDDTDEFSDDESWRRANGQSLDGEKIQHTSLCKDDKKGSCERSDGLINERKSLGLQVSTATPVDQGTIEPNAGSVARFTSVCTASFCASGLAARSTASKETNTESCSVLTNCHSSDQHTVNNNGLEPKVGEEVYQLHDLGGCNEKMKGLRNGSKTVRKLFTEDSLTESKEHPHNRNNVDGGDDMFQMPVCDGELAGLSYVDSQEPGEASQASALNFVEMFINDNCLEFDHEVDHGKSTGGKTKHVSSVKGPQSLAKKANERSTVGETGIFYWDDNLEDESGGNFILRRKEEFFGSGSHTWGSLTLSQKPKGRRRDKCRVKEEQFTAHDKITVHSDSKLTLNNLKENEKKVQAAGMNSKKNLVNELDERFETDTSREQLEVNARKTDVPQMPDVGVDTQIAAEAMEALFYGEGIVSQDTNGVHQGSQSNSKVSQEGSPRVKQLILGDQICLSRAGVATRQSKKRKRIGAKLSKESSVSFQKRPKNVLEESDMELVITKTKRTRSNAEAHCVTNGSENMDKMPSKSTEQRKEGEALESSRFDKPNRLNGHCSVKKQHLQEELSDFGPIAHRTRQSMVVSRLKRAENVPTACRKDSNQPIKVDALGEDKICSRDIEVSPLLNAKWKSSKVSSNQLSMHEQLYPKLTATDGGIVASNYPRRRISHQNLSGQVNKSDNLGAQSKRYVRPQDIGHYISGLKRSPSNSEGTCFDSTMRRKTRSSQYACPVFSSVNRNLEGKSSQQRKQNLDKPSAGDAARSCNSAGMNGKMISSALTGTEAIKHSERKIIADSSPSAEKTVTNVRLDSLPRGKGKPSDSACNTPGNCTTAVNAVSPVCMGDEYFRQSCKKNLSRSGLMKEISSLTATEPEPVPVLKDSRRRRDLANIGVLFSHHLDEDVIKQQKKILARLGVSAASSIVDATHFVADKFVRTRNMLEAIASGKPVVTHLWLESIEQVNIHIDEEPYILRDTKKEKEVGFSMPVSLARAHQFPLLQGRRVFITPNTKPSRETISTLVKAVHGKAVERIGRSALKDDKVPDDLLVLSCEEDYSICVPFLERGATVYSSELLLNGIVTQRLEYERHRLFTDHVKRTRSTIWLRKDSGKFLSVTSNK